MVVGAARDKCISVPNSRSATSVVAMNCAANGGLGANGPVQVGVIIQRKRQDAIVARRRVGGYSDAMGWR